MSQQKIWAAVIAAVTSLLILAPAAAGDEPSCTGTCDGSDYGYDYGEPGMFGEDYEDIPWLAELEGRSPLEEGNN